jgi:hypothetical protein
MAEERGHDDAPGIELLDDVTTGLKADKAGAAEDEEVVVHALPR